MSKCLQCNTDLSNNQQKYCSHACQQAYQHDRYIERWLDGKETGLKGEYQLSNHVRNWILDRDNCRCVSCGWSRRNSYTETIPLVIDHIDGNHQNNNQDNLRTLCPNCDSLTPYYKNANRGNGRHARRQRYKENKSY